MPTAEAQDAERPAVLDRRHEEVASSEPELTPGTLNRIRETFVPWTGFEAEGRRLRAANRRLLVIAGDPGTGRFTAAVWLGLKLLAERPQSRIVPLPPAETIADLRDWAWAPDRQRNTVYVMQRTSGAHGLAALLDSSVVEMASRRLLEELNSWLILVLRRQDLDHLHLPVEVLSVSHLDPEQLRQALDLHWKWLRVCEPGWELGASEARVRDAIQQLVAVTEKPCFSSVPQILRFLGRLPEFLNQRPSDNDQTLGESLETLARSMAEEVTQAWFDGLSDNERFLALLVMALEGFRREDLENLYCREALALRKESGLLEDPRAGGFEDLYRRINVQVCPRLIVIRSHRGTGDKFEIQQLEFTHENYRREVLRQMRSRHHLLWGVVRSVLTADLGTMIAPWQAPQRQLLGEVVARLGIHRPNDLEEVLRQLALHKDGIVASIPGYVLRGVCRLDEPDYRFVRRVLAHWVGSGNTDLVWAAMAALWRVYVEVGRQRAALDSADRKAPALDGLIDELEERVTEIVQSDVIGNLESRLSPRDDFVSYGLERMFEALPARTATLVRHWLGGRDRLQRAGRRAAPRFYEANREATTLSEPRFQALTDLVAPALRLDRTGVDRTLEVLLGWAERPEWHAGIARALLRACNRARDGERTLLRRAVSALWLRAHNPVARRIAQAVIGRARLMDGAPTELVGAGYGALLVDASTAGRVNQSADRFALDCFEFLRPQVDLWVGHLGNHCELCRPGEDLDIERLPGQRVATRLIMPWLERLGTPQKEAGLTRPLHFVFVLHWDKLVDEDDAGGEPGAPVVTVRVPFHLSIDGDPGTPLAQVVEVPQELLPYAGEIQVLVRGLSHVWRQHRRQILREQNEERSEAVLAHADLVLGACSSRVLVGRTAALWFEHLCAAAVLSPLKPDTEAEGVLTSLVDRIDDPPDDNTWPDPMRTALAVVQWMAARDLGRTVQRLNDWMALDVRHPRGNFAAAAATLLIRLRFLSMLPVPGSPALPPPAPEFAALLDLAPALARRRSTLGLRVFLMALRCWVADDVWATLLRCHPALVRLADAAPAWLRADLSTWLDNWPAKPLVELGEQRVPPAALALRLRLKCTLATRSRIPTDWGPMVLVILHRSGHRGARGRLSEVAAKLRGWAESQRQKGREVPQVLFMDAAVRHPVAVSGEAVSRESFPAGPTTGLVAPLIERLGPSASLILVLADGPVVDGDDWLVPASEQGATPATGAKLKLFWDNHELAPPSSDPPWVPLYRFESADQADFKRVVEALQAHLEPPKR
jgi:hypothetical protein